MMTKAIVLHETDSAYSAARAMKENNVGCVLVCDGSGCLKGLVTDRDIVVRAVCEDWDLHKVKLNSFMTRDVAALTVDKNLSDVVWMMKGLGVRRVPIVSENGKPLRVISIDDLLIDDRVKLKDLKEIVRKELNHPERLTAWKKAGQEQERAFESGIYTTNIEYFHELVEESDAFPEKSETKTSRNHRGHAEQSLGNMIRVARQRLENRNVFALDKECILSGLRMYFRCLVRRIKPGEAGNLIAQLPSYLHEELLSERAGPDTSLNLSVLERCVRMAMRVSDEQAYTALLAFTDTLMMSISKGEVKSLRAQLPEDIRDLFEQVEREERIERQIAS